MARHANGKNTYAVAGWVIAVAVIAAVALIAALVWALTRGGSGTDDAAQAEGSVAASKAGSQDAASAATSETKTESGSESAEPATSSSKAPASSTAPASTGSADTLLLLDTSDALAPNFDPVTGAAADAAQSLGEKNKQVALWNYSSPINPGVQVGYRTNLNFGPGADAAGAVTQFGTGGVPQTRSAVIAAVQAAAARGLSFGAPTATETLLAEEVRRHRDLYYNGQLVPFAVQISGNFTHAHRV